MYEITNDGTEYVEVARFPTQWQERSGAQAYGFVEAFDRFWINGYHITDKNLDIVGQLIDVYLGDFNDDRLLTLEDLEFLAEQTRQGSTLPIYDLNLDGTVDPKDRQYWVETLANTYVGDANLDGEFNSRDLVEVLRAGEFEDTLTLNSTWASGDWDGDGEFRTTDLLLALVAGGYERGPRTAVGVVPEPTGGPVSAMILLGTALWTCRRRRRMDGSPLVAGPDHGAR